jgi:hypothetical protein
VRTDQLNGIRSGTASNDNVARTKLSAIEIRSPAADLGVLTVSSWADDVDAATQVAVTVGHQEFVSRTAIVDGVAAMDGYWQILEQNSFPVVPQLQRVCLNPRCRQNLSSLKKEESKFNYTLKTI